MSIESPPLERKLVAILAADVEGYSRLMHADEEGTLGTLSSHRAVIDGLIAAASGRISSTAGDSVLAEFASVVAAVNCATMIQTALAVANADLPADRQMHFRIGINVGDVMMKDGGIFGDGVNVAARVEALAPPGGICVTRGVRDHVRDRLEYVFEDAGDHHVKNIARPIHVFRVVFDGSELAARTEATDPVFVPDTTEQDAHATTLTEPTPDAVELAFWQSAEKGNTALEYEAYIEHYPDGTFKDLAAARLQNGPTPVERPFPAVELAFWDAVKDSGDPALFRAYLDQYPDGAFRAIAEIKAAA